VAIEPGRQYRVFLALRSRDGRGELPVMLCEKVLLYSANCQGATFRLRGSGGWEDFGAMISSADLDQHVVLGWLRRPVEFSFFNPTPGTTIDVGHIRMLDPHDRNILVNGDFSRGTERWYFTDDDHVVWRIKNQYLMSLFECGALGLVALIVLTGTALAGAIRAIRRGEPMGAAVLGSLVAFLLSGLFDNLLEVPRLAALFYIVAFSGLTMMHTSMPRQIRADRAADRGR
jgi:hypothetical protein